MKHPFAEFLPTFTQKNGATLPALHSTLIAARGTVSPPRKSKLGMITAPHGVTITYQNQYQRPDQALNNESRNLTIPFLSDQGHCWPWWWSSCRKLVEHWGSSFIRLQLAKGECGWLWYGHSLQRLHLMLRHGWSVHLNCSEEVLEEGVGFLQIEQRQSLDRGSTEKDQWELLECVGTWSWMC